MEIAQIAVLIALAWMIIALVSNKVPFGAIGLGIPFILIIGGVFESPIKAMGDLAGPTTLLVASIMILAQGIFKSGLAEVIGNFALKLTGGRNSTSSCFWLLSSSRPHSVCSFPIPAASRFYCRLSSQSACPPASAVPRRCS